MTLVDRRTSCILGRTVENERSERVLQIVVDQAPQAAFDLSDLHPAYHSLLYTVGIDTLVPDKSDTYQVAGMNAELRHYLPRLARRSRCFSTASHPMGSD
jgi:IS1 family transposase